MAALNEAAVQAVELETVREEIPDLMLTEDTFYARLKKAGRVLPMSTSTGGSSGSTFDPTGRPSLRVPMRIAAGSTHQQFSADGGHGAFDGAGHRAVRSPTAGAVLCRVPGRHQDEPGAGGRPR